mmetsp:Transcript_53139/g.124392  ORF Transcript_53139/g.124392 Transcript_53139/m.124392 type:complete len:213 (+) Transcript_53139:3238-3876(+)
MLIDRPTTRSLRIASLAAKTPTVGSAMRSARARAAVTPARRHSVSAVLMGSASSSTRSRHWASGQTGVWGGGSTMPSGTTAAKRTRSVASALTTSVAAWLTSRAMLPMSPCATLESSADASPARWRLVTTSRLLMAMASWSRSSACWRLATMTPVQASASVRAASWRASPRRARPNSTSRSLSWRSNPALPLTRMARSSAAVHSLERAPLSW